MLSRLRDPGDDTRTSDAIATDLLRLRVASGVGPEATRRLTPRCRRALAVASAVGAPMVAAVDGAMAAEDDHRRARRAVRVASAQTRTVAVSLVAAPVVLVPGLARLVGADLIGFYRTRLGVAVLLVALLLMATGVAVVLALVRRVGRAPAGSPARSRAAVLAAMGAGILAWVLVVPVAAPGVAVLTYRLVTRHRADAAPENLDEAADLVATALSGGVGAPQALRIAAGQLPMLADQLRRLAFDLELGTCGREAVAGSGPFVRLRVVLAAAVELGAPVVPTLRRLARDQRADDLARVLAAAERLPAQLTFPTALCLLPATVLLIGAPIVHAGLAAVGT